MGIGLVFLMSGITVARPGRPRVRGSEPGHRHSEPIDAIRALTRTVEDSNDSIARTNAALRISPALV
jgi:hypothetical protein